FDDTVSRIDPLSGREVGPPVKAGDGPAGLAAAEGLIWVADYGGGTVSRIDARTAIPKGAPVRTGAGPDGVGVAQRVLWGPNFDDDTLSRIARSPRTGVLTTRFSRDRGGGQSARGREV